MWHDTAAQLAKRAAGLEFISPERAAEMDVRSRAYIEHRKLWQSQIGRRCCFTSQTDKNSLAMP